ncbi:MAG: hypothetical protein IAG13_37175, partial [Deltaproteobacteria bacterium]|nr:hypothetical protein [Nannocystaceae bacterium]
MAGSLANALGTGFLWALASCRPSATTDPEQGPSAELGDWHYVATLEPGAAAIAVELCFAGRPPDVLVPVVEEAAEHIGELRVVGSEARLRPRGGRFVLEGVEPGGCVRWRSDFEALLADGHDRSIQRVGDSVMVRQSMWL